MRLPIECDDLDIGGAPPAIVAPDIAHSVAVTI
jgi:hypothetical protein